MKWHCTEEDSTPLEGRFLWHFQTCPGNVYGIHGKEVGIFKGGGTATRINVK